MEIRGRFKFLKEIQSDIKKHPAIKFTLIFLIISAYFFFTIKSNGLKDGLWVSLLTWSFFVLCTPIADAGILIDFPINLISGIKMIYSEIIVWVTAIGMNILILTTNPAIYEKTIILSLFKHIIQNPFPYSAIIILSALGTFISIHLADDITGRKEKKIKKHLGFFAKHEVITFIFLIVMILIIYNFLLETLGINIPLI